MIMMCLRGGWSGICNKSVFQQLRYKLTTILNISVLSNTGVQLKMMRLWKNRVGKAENWLKKWVDIVLVVVYNGKC